MDEINDPQPQPDPSWHYYEVWNYLNRAKSEIDKALSHLKDCEVGSTHNSRTARILANEAAATIRHVIAPLLSLDEPD